MQKAVTQAQSTSQFNSQAKVRRRRGVVLTPNGLKRLQSAIQVTEIQKNQGNRYTLEQLSELINVSTKTLSRLWSLNSGVDQKTLRLCFSTFNLNLNPEDYAPVGDLDESDEEVELTPPPERSQEVAPVSNPVISLSPASAQTTPTERLSLPYPGGPLSPDSPYYISRTPIEELAYQEVQQPGCVIRIRAPRGMGKSSLAVRLLSFAEDQGYSTVLLDCNEIDSHYLTDLNKLLRCFCQRVSMELGIPPRLNDYWDEDIGSKLSCTLYFKHYLLQQIETPFVLVINAIDALFEHTHIAHEFFPMLRSWHEAARRDSDWQKLRQVVVYCNEDYPALDINSSPFNVGLPLRLSEFTASQTQELANRYGLNWSAEQIDLLMALIGGHPMLLQIAFYYLCSEGMSLEALLRQATIDGGVFRHYLRQRWLLLHKQPQLVEAFTAALQSEQGVQLDSKLADQLESHGLIRYESGRVYPRCHLYRIYFRQQLSSVTGL